MARRSLAPDLRHRTTLHESRAIATGITGVDATVDILRIAADRDATPTLFRSFDVHAVMIRSGEGWQVDAIRIHQRPAATFPADRQTP